MKINVQYKRRIAILGWVGLVVFAMHASIFFLSAEHVALSVPCAGMTSALCPILQHDLMRIDQFVIGATQIEILKNSSFIFSDARILAVVLFVLLLFICAWRHIRKRNYLYGLVHRYRQAFSRGSIQAKIYA